MKERRKQSGVALVITLIMLSVITIIAVAFLALSQRERAAVSTTLTGTEAELAANAGHERAKAEILAYVREFVNQYTNRTTIGPDLFVSRAELFDADFNFNDLLTDANYHRRLTNLFYDPPPPVFSTNRTGRLEQVHYLDLNRNGRYESNGVVSVLNNSGTPIQGETNYVVGDPQWIGITARPNERHSSSNRFIGRYSFLVVPAGRTLDIDYIHNHAKDEVALAQPGFHRKQGHGTWEINLAAFLADLNTNQWGRYNYNTNRYAPSTLEAFEHAQGILRYRYANNQLRSARSMFGFVPTVFADDGIDQYADGDDWDATANRFVDNDGATPLTSRAWPGSSNPERFFSLHDFYNLKGAPTDGFYQALTNTGFALNSYDAHTFYRMLAQLGTDSAPEKMRVRRADRDSGNVRAGDFLDSARINLNYVNTNPVVAADFQAWEARTFFEVAADRLLQAYGFGDGNRPLSVTNLPIYPTNYYTPSVHRILQMTLNIFDATTNQGVAYPYFPTPLRPVFESSSGGNEVRIVGYERVPQNNWAITNALNWRHLSNATDRAALNASTPNQYVYGIPVLVGAKKGFPNFNEYVLQSIVQVERKVNIEKRGTVVFTNQLFFMGISNVFGVEAWNSYTNPYPRNLIMVAGLEQNTVLTNNEGFTGAMWPNSSATPFVAFSPLVIPANTWQGEQFQIPLGGVLPQDREGHSFTNQTFLTNSIYRSADRKFYPTNQVQLAIEPGVFAAPQWVLTSTNRLRFFLFDNGHLIDAVGLAPSIEAFNITEALHRMSEPGANDPSFGAVAPDDNYWLTNRLGGAASTQTRVPTRGLQNQIDRARRGTPPWGGDANRSALEAQGFRQFLAMVTNPTNEVRTNMWVPFVPQQKVYHNYIWQANDPLVHYLAEDLRFKTNSRPKFSPVNSPTFDMMTIGRINGAYQPWGGPVNQDPEQRTSDVYNPRITDMNVRRSDSWDFPTNSVVEKFATIGMLGRIHRGTPWQTVYFKSNPPDDPTWAKHHQGGRRSNPTNDWRLVDVFTVAQHPNASYGRLSVNQTNVAAWSAVLGGVDVSTIADVGGSPRVVSTNIQPVHVDNNRTIEKLVAAINFHRENSMTGQVFSSLSEVLGVPELTSSSLFLTQPVVASPPPLSATPLRDRDMESIPEKILSLLHRGEARFVIYAFGQSLKPAPQSILTGGTYRGLVTNYEVSGELASRAVVRIEFDNNRRPYAVVESFNVLPPD